MSTTNWVGVGQLTFVLIVSWFAARLWLSRQPQIAAKVCLVGLVMSTIFAISMVFSVPRPLTYKAHTMHQATANGVTKKAGDNRSKSQSVTRVASSHQNLPSPLGGFGLRLRGEQLLESLRSLSRHSHEHAVLMSMIGLCMIAGAVLQVCVIAFGTWNLMRLRSGAT